MKLIYVAGPYRAETKEATELNIKAAARVGVEVARRGFMPVIPHNNTAHFEHYAPEVKDDFWLQGTLELLSRCDALVTVVGWQGSSGSVAEVEFCRDNNIPVYWDPNHINARDL